MERNTNLSPSWGFPISPQDCVTLLDPVMLRHWGKLSSGPPTPGQFHCFCLLPPLGIVALSYSHLSLGQRILGKAVSGPFGLCAPYSHSLPSLRSCCFPGDDTREWGILCPLTYLFLPLTPEGVSLGVREILYSASFLRLPFPGGFCYKKAERLMGVVLPFSLTHSNCLGLNGSNRIVGSGQIACGTTGM